MSSRPKNPKYARNKNILVVGGSGSGKTRFFVKPNIMQLHSSYCITDPKGTLLVECGNLLAKAKYQIKVLNLINFKKSMHYNPFMYIHSEKDILKLVNTIIANTKGEGDKSGEDFWVKAEKLYYQALIGYIWYEAPEDEMNFSKDVIACPTDYYVLCHIARLVNEGFYMDGGRIRGVPVTIGGTTYIPPLPIEQIVREELDGILRESEDAVGTAIRLCLYCMKAQLFNDGNKRAAVIVANHYMIAHGQGLLVIPESVVPEFKRLLVAYYEDRDNGEITAFLREKCWRKF